MSTYIAFSNSADGLMELLVGDSGLAGVKRQVRLGRHRCIVNFYGLVTIQSKCADRFY